jgi:phage shock protein PspC (stress-responsive transcriptional regulator)
MVGGPPRRHALAMSTTPPSPPPPQTPPPPPEPERPEAPDGDAPRRLLRSRDDRVVAGVAGGLGRYFAIDPVIVRIVLVGLTFFGGAGLLLYLAAVLLVPSDDEVPGGAAAATAGSPPLAGTRNRGLVIAGVVVLVLVASPVALFAGGIIVPLAFLALAGLLVAWLVTGERPGRDAGSLVRATVLGIAVLVLCGALAVGAFWLAGIGGDAVVAGIVIGAGVAVLAAAFLRPARWLILPALAIAIPAGFVAAAGIDLDGGYGERTYRPASPSELAQRYQLGAGQLVVDLRGVDLPAGDRRLNVEVGMGEAVVIVPDDVCVATDAELGMGGVDVFDRDTGGIDVDFVDQPVAGAGATRLLVDADIGVGHLDVRKTELVDRHHFDEGRGPFGRDRFGPDRFDEARGSNTGCA